MQTDDIEPELRAFVAEKIPSVAQLEAILLLLGDPQKSWTAVDASRALYISPEMAAGLLAELSARGLARVDPDAHYRYGPAAEEMDRHVRQLAELYKSRRVSVISLIHSSPVDKLRRFADAFRFSRDPKKDG